MQYCYMILYAYEKGYASTEIVFDKRIIDYQDIKEIEWKIRKKINVHAHILNYKLIKKLPKKESRFDKMETFEYLEYLRNVVNKWREKI